MHRFWTRLGITASACACLLAVACATVEPVSDRKALTELYEAAIRDAAVFDPAHRALLRAIAEGQATASVVTWARVQDAAREFALADVTLSHDTWVTLDGDVRERCRRFDRTDEARLTTRLQQLLGLAPMPEARLFVTFRAPVAAMFRPCLDPDVTRTTCDRGAFPTGASVEHEAWIAGQMVTSYRVGDTAGQLGGRPFTGLGYTYDWAPRSSHVGPAEYVVRAGTPVSVVASESSSAYCAW
jgi:hypothetical protein